jgi:peptidoglycan L-alanyl-D-glutamate endopeptidase CwlK
MNIDALIRAVQKELGVGVDGKPGPVTWTAIHRRVCGDGAPGDPPPKLPPGTHQKVDDRSEKIIATLQPEVQPYARALVLRAADIGITIKVISGLRTYDEQNALYAKGRTKPGSVVTNARGGYSNHNFGIAFDIGVFRGTAYVPESPQYKAIGAIGTELGLEWGGNWKTIKDEPHFQLRPKWASDVTEREMLASLRQRNDAGTAIFV